MAFAYLSAKTFYDGTNSEFDTETDDSSYLNIYSYKHLAKNNLPVPYRGAYAPQINFATKGTSTDPAYFCESTDLDTTLAADGEAYVKFYIYCPSVPAWTMANNNAFEILGLYASTTSETAIGIIYTTAAGYRLYVDGGAATTYSNLTFDKWICIEAYIVIDKGAENDGATTVYVDGVQAMTTVTANQGGITEYRYGVVGPDAGTTSGTIYLGPIVFDDARLYPDAERFPFNRIVNKTEQVFVGPGHLDSVSLLTTNADDVVKLYDTDLGTTAVDESGFKVAVSTATYQAVSDPIGFEKGCYAVLSGTGPRAQIVMTEYSNVPGVCGPIYNSAWGWKHWGATH